MFTEQEILRIVNRIVNLIRPDKVLLYGSYAKKTATIKSDLDILIIKDSNLPRRKRMISLQPLTSGYAIPVNVVVYTPQEIEEQKNDKFSFISSVFSSAKELYTKRS